MPWRTFLRNLRHPLRYVQERIDAWVLARVKRLPGPIVINRHRVYIVPSRFGYVFGLMVFVMLLGAMNYSNSMAFSLSFLLVALGLVAMHHTHGNLVNVQLRAGRVEPVFAGETAHFEIVIDNPAPQARYSLTLGWLRAPLAAARGDVPPLGSAILAIPLSAPRRGWLPARIFRVSTEFPLGLFHAWTWVELDVSCLVFPKPVAAGAPPAATAGAGGVRTGSRAGQDEFAGLRNYQRGDTPRSVHWKSLPKLQVPMVKQFSETLEQELWLDWDSLPGLDSEARLSHLTRWALDAEAEHR
ncbi:MAG: DUF58 domain-containing protein, partial [Acidobacteria bacterium]|nr:DUF58 domain-containing protein [Acidobacteriota bacterium]